MKRTGIIHAQLERALTGLRHADIFVVTDSGCSVPAGVEVIDLALEYGTPTVTPVLRAILREVVVEAAWVAEEMTERNPSRRREVEDSIGSTPLGSMPHEELRGLLPLARFVVQRRAAGWRRVRRLNGRRPRVYCAAWTFGRLRPERDSDS